MPSSTTLALLVLSLACFAAIGMGAPVFFSRDGHGEGGRSDGQGWHRGSSSQERGRGDGNLHNNNNGNNWNHPSTTPSSSGLSAPRTRDGDRGDKHNASSALHSSPVESLEKGKNESTTDRVDSLEHNYNSTALHGPFPARNSSFGKGDLDTTENATHHILSPTTGAQPQNDTDGSRDSFTRNITADLPDTSNGTGSADLVHIDDKRSVLALHIAHSKKLAARDVTSSPPNGVDESPAGDNSTAADAGAGSSERNASAPIPDPLHKLLSGNRSLSPTPDRDAHGNSTFSADPHPHPVQNHSVLELHHNATHQETNDNNSTDTMRPHDIDVDNNHTMRTLHFTRPTLAPRADDAHGGHWRASTIASATTSSRREGGEHEPPRGKGQGPQPRPESRGRTEWAHHD